MKQRDREKQGGKSWQQKLYIIIFKADTAGGKAFDVALLLAILLSIFAVMLESVESINSRHGSLLRIVEWSFTILFTIEYMLRIICVRKPWRYATSFFGLVDFCAIIPTYLSIILINTQYLLVIRALRLLRIFRIFKLGRYLSEGEFLLHALKASRPKITVFLGGVGSLVVIMGTLMYLVEGAASGFTSIPRSIYWAIVTLTTVGYGDIAPQTFAGQAIASLVMILGYSIIAVPTGIVTVEMGRVRRMPADERECESCGSSGHDRDAAFCKFCGSRLIEKAHQHGRDEPRQCL